MKEKELTLKEAEKIVDTMYQNKFVEAGVEEGNTIHLGNMDNIQFNDLENASIYLLRKEIRLREELQRKDNIINELKESINNFDVFKEFTFPLMKRDEEQQVISSIDYEWRKSIKEPFLNKIKEIEIK